MSLIVKGFVTNQTKVNNAIDSGKGVVAKFGELSPDSKTYAKELGYYAIQNTPFGFITFTAKDESGLSVELPGTTEKLISDAIVWSWSRSDRVTPITYAEFVYGFKLQFENQGVSEVIIGEIESDGTSYMPSFLEFRTTEDTHIKLWFSDDAFSNQYPDFEIVIVPPTDSVDDFWLSFDEIKLKLETKNNPQTVLDAIQTARDGFPFTYAVTEIITFTNPNNVNEKIQTYWVALVYGGAGNNPDLVREELINYVLNKSRYSRDAWSKIMPDLFKQNEFYLLPEWTNIAIETTAVVNKGINSTISNTQSSIMKLTDIAKEYPSFHVALYADVWATAFKPLLIYSIAHPEMKEKKFSIKDWYTDYLPVTTASIDFNRMSDITQEWILILNKALLAAEQYSNLKSLPRQFTAIKRNDKIFICFSHRQIKFLIYAKVNDINTGA